jgi:hypothetical protein
MAEEVKDVAESVPAEEVVKEEQVATPVQESQEEVSSTQEVKPEVKQDRPIENVMWEVKRKVDETIPQLHSKIEELTNLVKEQRSPTQPTYSKAQLHAYASEPTTTTEQRLWAYTELDKLEKTERQREYETLVTSTRKNTEAESRKAQAANWVAQTFPDTVVKDNSGNNLGWNNQSQILMRANDYMNRSETLRNDPEGFMAAVKMAAFDLGITPKTNQKIDRTVGQLRKEQKKQLASAGGTRVQETSDVVKKNRMDKLKEEYAKTGDKKIFAELIKMKGINPYL